MNVFVILPNQLFLTDDIIDHFKIFSKIYIVEEPLILNNKDNIYLPFFIACMYMYEKKLISNDICVEYIKHKKGGFINALKNLKAQVHMYYPANIHLWEGKLFSARFSGLPIKFYESPGYLLTREYIHKLSGKISFMSRNDAEKKKYINKKLGKQCPATDDNKLINDGYKHSINSSRTIREILHITMDYMKAFHAEYSPNDLREDLYTMFYPDYLPVLDRILASHLIKREKINKIQLALQIGILLPCNVLLSCGDTTIRKIVYDREFNYFLDVISNPIQIKHRRYEFEEPV